MLRRPPLLVAALVVGVSVIPCHSTPGAACPVGPSRQRPAEGEICGRVTEANGNAAPGVTVTVSGAALLLRRTAVTRAGGAYLLIALPPGPYRIAFERGGCRVAQARDVQLPAGFHLRLDVSIQPGRECLERAPDSQTVSMPVLDSSTTVADIVAGDLLAQLPLGWDPLATLEPWLPRAATVRAPGGPSEGEARASHFTLPINALYEIQIRRAAADPSVRRAGVTSNLITRSGSGHFAGSVRYSLSDHRLESDNLDPFLRSQGMAIGSRVLRASQVGAEAGGPFVRDRAWWWAATGRARRETGRIGFYRAECVGADGSPLAGASDRLACLAPDVTTTSTLNAKVQTAWRSSHETIVSWAWSSRENPSRGASAYTRREATTRQHGLGHARPLKVQHRWTISDRWGVEGAYGYNDGGYVREFQDAALSAVQAAYDRYTLARWRSATRSRHLRSTTDAEMRASLFQAAWPGGDHECEFGVQFLDAREHQADHTGGGAVAVFDSRTGQRQAWQARILRDGDTRHSARTWSAFVRDAVRTGRFTLSAGVRFDRQDDQARGATIPASPIIPEWLPAVRFPGADSGVVYRDVSPRLGLVWDLTGRARTLLKAAAARYTATGNDTSSVLQPTGQTRLAYWWNDANGDTFVQRDELDLARGPAATPSSNYDPAHPAAVKTPARVDPALRNVMTDEASVRLEQQVSRPFTVRATYVVRKTHRFQRTFRVEADGSPVGSDTFAPARWTPVRCPSGAECPTVIYYERDTPLPSDTLLRNDGEYSWLHTLEMSAHKRLSHGWMLDASLALNRASWHVPAATRDYTDPTNIAMRDGTGYSTSAPHWAGRLAGSLRLPKGMGTAGILTGRQGDVFDRVVSSPGRGALGSTRVSVKRFGSERHPDVWQLDWRLDWKRAVGALTVVPTFNVTNVLNANTVLTRNRVQNSQTANAVTDIAAPRRLQIDVTVAW